MKKKLALAFAVLAVMSVAVSCTNAGDDVESKVESTVSKAEDIVSTVESKTEEVVSDVVSDTKDAVSDIASDVK